MPTQTSKDTPASRVTGEEIKGVLLELRPKINKCYRARPQDFESGGYIHWDRATWHGRKYSDAVFGRSRKPHVTVRFGPALSPDFNKPAEHAINLLKQTATRYFRDHPEITDWQVIREKVRQLFYGLKKEGFRKDIMGLKKLYERVNQGKQYGGSEGDYSSTKD